MEEFAAELSTHIFGNPHSKSAASQRSELHIDQARLRVLTLLNTSPRDYELVFVQNATAGLKLLGEALGHDWQFLYSRHAHTSLLGLRELAKASHPFDSKSLSATLESLTKHHPLEDLVVGCPAQSNFSGDREVWSSEINAHIKRHGSRVYTLLDAAAMATSKAPDLGSLDSPDFVVLSFYKMFGFPDLGALLVKKRGNAAELPRHKKYFGGGTVELATLDSNVVARKQKLHEKLEDGTVPFHSIIALDLAIEVHRKIYGSFERISKHTSAVALYAVQRLQALTHPSSRSKLVTLYSDSSKYEDPLLQGPIIAFNLKDSHGNWIGYSTVEEVCAIENISVRTGTLCNAGEALLALEKTEEEAIMGYKQGHACGDQIDLIDAKPTGAVRISFGAMSSISEVDAFINCLEKYFLESEQSARSLKPIGKSLENKTGHVKSILVYPIKSCASYRVPANTAWQVTLEGLKWDREFCVVSTSTGNILSMKKHMEMSNIVPILHLDTDTLEIKYVGTESVTNNVITIPLSPSKDEFSSLIDSKLCGDKVCTIPLSGFYIEKFFSEILGQSCTLARCGSSARYFKPDLPEAANVGLPSNNSFQTVPDIESQKIKIALANSSPLLLVSESSARELDSLSKDLGVKTKNKNSKIDTDVFRGNIVIDGNLLQPYAEDEWSQIRLGQSMFTVSFYYYDYLYFYHYYCYSSFNLQLIINYVFMLIAIRSLSKM